MLTFLNYRRSDGYKYIDQLISCLNTPLLIYINQVVFFAEKILLNF